jgi:hypothetical protein
MENSSGRKRSDNSTNQAIGAIKTEPTVRSSLNYYILGHNRHSAFMRGAASVTADRAALVFDKNGAAKYYFLNSHFPSIRPNASHKNFFKPDFLWVFCRVSPFFFQGIY